MLLSHFRLDGGALYGVVPRVLWERFDPPDERHRVKLVCRALWIEGEGASLLVDAGMGEKFGEKEVDIYHLEQVPERDLPFRWESLTHVIVSHLHFDHSGGLTRWSEEGRDGSPTGGTGRAARLKTPRARVYVQRANWERAQRPGPRERASYLRENLDPLELGALVLVDGAVEVLPGVQVHRSDGHTEGLQWVTVSRPGETIAFPSDLVPTAKHLHLPFVMGYDMRVDSLLAEKEAFLRQAVDEDWIVVFAHDPQVPAARISRDERGRFILKEVIESEVLIE